MAGGTSTTVGKRRNRSIAWRLALSLGAVIAALGLVSVACLWALFDIHHRLHALKQDEEKARSVVRLASAVRDQYAHVAHTIIIQNDTHAALFRESSRALVVLAANVRAQPALAGAGAKVDEILEASRVIERLFEERVLPDVRAGDHAALASVHDRILRLAMQAQEGAEDLARQAEASMEDLNAHVRATQHGAILLTIIVHGIALVTAIFVGLYLYRSIARPIAALSAAAARVSGGDLDTVIGIERTDELGDLAARFNEMTRSVKQHQRTVLQTEKLAGLGRVAAGIAHELNNPVGVILGYVKLLRRQATDDAPRILQTIEDEAERCRQVVEGLLELTRGPVLDAAAVRLGPLAAEVVERLKVASGSPDGVAVDIRGDGLVVGDMGKLRQVLTNLVKNALDAAGQGGRVTVVIESAPRGVVTVSVADSGGGVRPEDQQKLFEPFFTTKPTGTGLGLAVSRAIARAHGGDIELASGSAGETTFRLTLPASGKVAS